jgi:hypothetical protein
MRINFFSYTFYYKFFFIYLPRLIKILPFRYLLNRLRRFGRGGARKLYYDFRKSIYLSIILNYNYYIFAEMILKREKK